MSSVRNVTPSNYPVAPGKYVQQYFDQFTNVLRLNLNNITNAINAPKVFGSYYDTTLQTNPVASAENLFTLNSTVVSYGTKVGSPTSRVYVGETGVYNIQFSAQLDKSGGGASAVYIWLKINGEPVPNSAGKVVINGPNSEIIPAWNFVVILKANDYFELVWSSSDTAVVILAEPAVPPVPQIPSIILTVTWVSGIPPRV